MSHPHVLCEKDKFFLPTVKLKVTETKNLGSSSDLRAALPLRTTSSMGWKQ